MVCVLFGHGDSSDKLINLVKTKILEIIRDYEDVEFFVGNNGNFDFISQKALREISDENESFKYYIVLSRIDERALVGDNEYAIFPEGQELVPKRFTISRRNDWLLKKADMALCYVRYVASNSYKLLKKAERRGVSIINIAAR